MGPQEGDRGAPHPGVPLVESLDVDEGHFPIGSGHDTIMLTTDNQVNVISKLPPAVPATKKKLSWSPQTLNCRYFTPYRVRSVHTPPEVTYRYATEAISFLSMSSSTNGFGLGKLYLSFPCKDDKGVTRQRQLVAKPIDQTLKRLVTAQAGFLGPLKGLSSLHAVCLLTLSEHKHPMNYKMLTASVYQQLLTCVDCVLHVSHLISNHASPSSFFSIAHIYMHLGFTVFLLHYNEASQGQELASGTVYLYPTMQLSNN